jgi:hypothetical protein
MRLTLRFVPALIVAASLAPLLLLPAPGSGTPLYATRMGLACANCHFDPNGGGPRNAFGFAFAKNRHSTDAETSGVFKDLDLTNKVSEQLPLYFGVNQRFMTLIDEAAASDTDPDRFGFFSMETELHLAFQPHSRLTLVYTQDGFGTDARVTREAWGMLGLTPDIYLRAGVFRSPFGLRMDDHTVATRNGFTDFQTFQAFVLPYDPRIADQGFELGATKGKLQGRIAFTNGSSSPLNPTERTHAQTVAGKLAYVDERYQFGLSGYDQWEPAGILFPDFPATRADRWGAYATTRRGPVSLIGEIVSGTDQMAILTELKVNRLGWFVEGDYQASRGVNFRLRYDRLEGVRFGDLRDQYSYDRYALEGEVVPVPFCEVRWTLRLIDPVAAQYPPPLGTDRDTEKQAYLQMHFSY